MRYTYFLRLGWACWRLDGPTTWQLACERSSVENAVEHRSPLPSISDKMKDRRDSEALNSEAMNENE